MQFDYRHYVPCLKWKQGEYQAILQFNNATKKSFTPLIEVPEIGWDFEKGENIKTLEKHLELFAKRVANKWGKAPCIIDLRCIQSLSKTQEYAQSARFTFNKLREDHCFAIPAISLNNNSVCQQEIKTILKEDKNGLCLRISPAQALKQTLKKDINEILEILAIQSGETHLVLDLEAPNYMPLNGFTKLIKTIVSNLPHLNVWRTFSILSTSIPETKSSIKKGVSILDRYEWLLYKKIIKVFLKEKLRLPTFSDYVISHPSILPPLDMRLFNPSALIKYTIDDKWFMVKGKGTKVKNGFKQFKDLSKKIISTQYYCGPSFSYGDAYIEKCANGSGSSGNLTSWIKVGTNHHIQKVIKDVANFYDS